MNRQRAFSGTPWEEKAGYCRALRVGDQIYVSGTAPADGKGGTFAPGDAYAQTKRCFEIIQAALEELGSDLSDVVRTRLYVTDMSRWEEFADAHRDLFGDNPPVNTMIEIPRLVDPDMLVEVEVEVVCQPQQRPSPLPSALQYRPIERRPLYSPTSPQELDEGCLD